MRFRPLRSALLCGVFTASAWRALALSPAHPVNRRQRRRLVRLHRHLRLLSVLTVLAAGPTLAQTGSGLPDGGAFVRGQGQIGLSGPGTLDITQSTTRGVIDWRSFSIAGGGQVRIDNGAGATLNRVLGGQLSQIDGRLTATGSVYLINPNGVIVGPGGQVLTNGSFVATTRQMNIDGFMAGGPVAASGASTAPIINNGQIVSQNGSVALIARSVANYGSIQAPNGRVSLAAASDVLLTTTDGSANNIYVQVAPGDGGGDVTQAGRIQAAAAALKAADGNIFALAGNRDALIQATGSQTINGELWLTAPKGEVNLAGTVVATNADGTGGKIVANGQSVSLASTARLSAAGTKGGEVLVGTSQFGTGADLATRTTIADGAAITAGGPGGAGRIETSGHSFTMGAARIAAGVSGQWLLDPDDLTIDAAAASTLTASLDAGTNVTQQTTAGGTGGVGDITVAAPVVWTGSGDLTLNAYRDLAVDSQVSGGGSVTLISGRNTTIAAPVTAPQASLTATGSITLAAGGQIAAASGVTLTGASFVNQAGAGALSSSGGRWLVYSTDPANDQTGGLAPAFYQYDAPAGATPAASGNGLLYSIAPSVSVTLGQVVKTYDGTTTAPLDDSNTAVSGLINSDTWTLNGQYASKDAGADIAVTASNFLAFHGGAPVYGYTLSTPTITTNDGIINRATLTASIIGTPTKVYNGTTSIALLPANFQVNGVVTGETINVSGASSGALDSANAGDRTVSATLSSPNFTAGSGTLLTNYILPTTASGAALVSPAPLIVLNVTAQNKVYDSTTAATLNVGSASLFGVIGADDVTLSSSQASGTFATKNVGTGIAVTASGFTVSGSAASNYVISQPGNLSANITKASLLIEGVTINDKVYDGTTTASINTANAFLQGLIAGDDVTVTPVGSVVNFTSKNVGDNIPVVASNINVTGADAGNYNVTQAPGYTGNITPAPLSAVITGNPTRTYDGTTEALVAPGDYTLTGVVAGESITIIQTAGAIYDSKNAGSRTVTATLTTPNFQPAAGTLLSNYTLPTVAQGPGTIDPATLTITIIGDPTKRYDGNTNASLGPGNYEIDGFVTGEAATVTKTTGTYSSADAGTRTVTTTLAPGDFSPDSGTLMSNYVIVNPVEGVGTITTIPIGSDVITAAITGNPTKVYDGNNIATLTPQDYTLTGFITGEGASVNQTVGQYGSINAGQQSVTALLSLSNFDPYPGTNLANYTLPTEATGIGTITRAQLTIRIVGNPTKVYDGSASISLSPANFSFAGFVSGEGASFNNGTIGAFDSANAGARTATANFETSIIEANSGTLLTNYTVPTTATGPGTITKALLTIAGASAQNKVYDTTTTATLDLSNLTLSGAVAGDDVNLDSAGYAANFATKNVGNNIAVTVTGFTLTGSALINYDLAQPAGLTANITPKGVAVINAIALDKPYDGTTAATLNLASATLSGVYASDTVGLVAGGASGVFSQSHVGTNLPVATAGFSLTGPDAGNYALTQPSLTASITPAVITGSIIGDPTKTYDGTTRVRLTLANYSLSGFIAGEGATLTQSAGSAYDLADAGARTVSANVVSSDFRADIGTDLSNYSLPTTITGPGTINPAALFAAIINDPTKVYDATTAAIMTSNNYQLFGFVSGEGAAVTQASGLYDSKNVGGRNVSASLSATDFTANSGTNLANYILPTTAAGRGTITPATVQVIDVTALNKVYDGTRTAQLDTGAASLSGVFAGDTVDVVSGGYSALFATKNVGTNITVTAMGFEIAGADAGNYTVLQPVNLAANITQATLTLARVTKVYDAGVSLPTASSAYTLSGVFSGDVVSVDTTGIAGAYADKNVGTGKSVSLTGLGITGDDAGNYTIASSVSNQPIGVITRANLLVVGVAALDKTYDQTTTAILDNSGAGLQTVLGTDDVTLNTGGATGNFVTANAGMNLSVIASGYVISGVDAGNYNLIQPQGLKATINPKQIDLVSVVKIYDGGVGLPTSGSGYGFSGVYSGDIVTADTSNLQGSYAAKNVGGTLSGGVVTNGIDVTLSGLALTGAQAGNYVISPTITAQPIGVITPKQLTAAIIGDPTKVYDTTTAATLGQANYSISGFVSDEGATVTQTAGLYDSKNAGARTVTATLGLGDFNADSGTLLTNYILPTSASGAGTITPAPASVIGAIANNKVYDGTTAATINNNGTTLGGRLGSDDLTLLLTGSGQFADKNVGTGIKVTTTGYALSGADAGNYVLSQPDYLAANITQATLTLIRVQRVYNALTDLPTDPDAYRLSGVVNGDTVAVSTANVSGAYADKNVGNSKNVTVNGLAIIGVSSSNYVLASSVANDPIGVITPATVSLTGVLANSKIYDGTTALTLNNANTAVFGTLGSDDLGVNSSGSSAVFPSVNVGTYSVSASGYVLTGADAGNYILTQPSGISASITPKQLAAAIIGDPTKVYNGNTAAALTGSNYQLTGFVGAEGAGVTQTNGLYDDKNAGARTVTATLTAGDFTANSGTLLSNYILPTDASGAGTITQAQLTASIVNNPTKVYDGALSASLTGSNYALAGFVGGEGAVVTQTSGLYDSADAGGRTVTATLAAGDFTADSGTLLSNYILPTTARGAGTITQAQLVAVITGDPTKVYDGNTAAILTGSNYQLTGFVGNQGASVNQASGVYDSKNAGPRTVTATLAGGDFTANSGTNLANYILPVSASGDGTITQAQLTASIINDPTKQYDGTRTATLDPNFFSLGGFVGGEGASVTQTSGAYDDKNAGARTVTANLAASDFTANSGTLLSNYMLPTTATGPGTIDPAILTVGVVGLPSKVYDGNLNIGLTPANYSIGGVAAGEEVTVTKTQGFFNNKNAGIQRINVVLSSGDFSLSNGALASNYVLPSNATGFGVITKATLTASIINDPTKVYDGNASITLASNNYQLSGFVSGEGASINEPSGAYDSPNAGTRTVTADLGSADFIANSGTLLSNYNLPTEASGIGHITQAMLTASIINDPTKSYDGGTNAILNGSNYQLSGFIAGQGASVTQTSGAYDGPNAGAHTVTASLGSGDFSANSGTLLSNYLLPTSASGSGHITQAVLSVSLTGVAKTYDGTTDATLTSGNYAFQGLAPGESLIVGQTAGTYGSPDAGLRTVTTGLVPGDFTAGSNTLLSNYVLPSSASGLGRINPAVLIATIAGDPTRTYDGTTIAPIDPGGGSATGIQYGYFVLTGFVAGQGATITASSANYDSANAGDRTVTASLGAGDFTANTGTSLSNYVLPTTATGPGRINQAMLSGVLINASKTYDGTTDALLGPNNYQLIGFITGEGASVTQTHGMYDGPDAGAHQVVASLGAGDFTASSGTLLSNYVLPTSLNGQGVINRAVLTASIVGMPTKMYDGTPDIALVPGNFSISGFVAGQGGTITATHGLFEVDAPGIHLIDAVLAAGDFTANAGTLLSNYVLPTLAVGPGEITIPPPDACKLVEAVCYPTPPLAYTLGNPRSFVPYPTSEALYLDRTSAFGDLPTMSRPAPPVRQGQEVALESGPVINNSSEQVLLQGDKDKRWRIVFEPRPIPASLNGMAP